MAFPDLIGWVQAGGQLGLLALASKLFVDNRKLRLAEKSSDHDHDLQIKQTDRDGWVELIKLLQGQVARMDEELQKANARIRLLEDERQEEHALVLQLVKQLNRTQAVELLASTNLSPAMRRAMISTLQLDGDVASDAPGGDT